MIHACVMKSVYWVTTSIVLMEQNRTTENRLENTCSKWYFVKCVCVCVCVYTGVYWITKVTQHFLLEVWVRKVW